MKTDRISELTTTRLSIYLRCLNDLAAEGRRTISSDNLAKRFHLNSAQIRKDLACFGDFGVRGVGYFVEDLRDQITRILGLDRSHRVAIIGAGRLGAALADYYGFTQKNFTIVALFDNDPAKIGQKMGDVTVYDIEEFGEVVGKEEIDVAVIAVPADFAASCLERIEAAGIRAVMNFAPTALPEIAGVKIKTIDLTISLENLSYFLAKEAHTGPPDR